ncbi:MAG: DUF86 domain-containing protein [Polyangiaceae bacterium]
MTNRLLVLRKLSLVRERVLQARSRRSASPEALRSNDVLLDALALSVLIAVQEAIDIAFHIATDEGWGVPASYAEGFAVLAKHGVFDSAVARSMTAAAGLRNRIAHAYATVDVERLWHELPEGLDAMDAFALAVATFVGPE